LQHGDYLGAQPPAIVLLRAAGEQEDIRPLFA
jgi:hypothetical protein